MWAGWAVTTIKAILLDRVALKETNAHFATPFINLSKLLLDPGHTKKV